MTQSMTGFATVTVPVQTGPRGQTDVTISLKSVNARFFELSCRFPYVFSAIETATNRLLKKKLIRGHIYCTINLSNPIIFNSPVTPSIDIVTRYVNSLRDIQNQFSLSGTVSIETIAQLPHVFAMQETPPDETVTSTILTAIDNLADKLIADRSAEGAMLEKDLRKRIENMNADIAQITIDSKQAVEDQKKKIEATLAEIGDEKNSLLESQTGVLYSVLDKIDVHEEIIRFKSHLEKMSSILNDSRVEKGKRLDFILQELGREVNTILAKCSFSTISGHALNAKVDIEKAREQTQNII